MAALTSTLQDAIARKDSLAALRLCETRLQSEPDDVEALRHLGLLEATRGRRGAALEAAERACRLAPADPRCWSELGLVHVAFGNDPDAAACFTRAVECDRRFAEGWHNLGTVLKRLDRPEAAFDALKTALVIDPTRADTNINLGALLVEAGQFEDALACFQRAVRHRPDLPKARSTLARSLAEEGKLDRAEALFRQSLSMDPDHVEGWVGLGRALEDLGDREAAQAAYRNALRRRPGHAPALGQYLALLPKEKAEPRLLAYAHRALRNPEVKDEAKALIGYGLAKHLDAAGDFQAAAEAGTLANAARRRAAGPLDRDSLKARVDCIIATYTREFFAARRSFGVGSDHPVFIVGLPRSGTTLTEQILAAHPLLHGAGELPALGRIAAATLEAGDQHWQAAARLDLARSRQLGKQYLRHLRNGAPRKRRRISDKAPLNLFHLGFAALLFPNARIVHCRRAPRDNALSIWLENFKSDQTYATEFDDLAFFQAQCERLMAHWKEVLPLPVLTLQYEETVADLEGQARRLIDFLGVPWNSACLEFHASDRAVQTPSRWQVRQPIYARSVGRWKSYAPFLPELDRAFTSRD
jgi:tetratricopeptide (TPR) repeat protein